MLDISSWNNFNCVETIAILVCKQINFNSFKNEITYELIFYIYLFKCVQTNDWCYIVIFT